MKARREGRALRALVVAVLALGIVAPIAGGLWQTLRAGLGLVPAIGAEGLSLEAWRALLARPGLATSLGVTLWTGWAATLLSLLVALGAFAGLFRWFESGRGAQALMPFLATPHAALAIGLAFVLAPSGWIARLLAPLFGLDRPPDIATVGDPWGLALILGLMVKEVPFLLLMLVAAAGQVPVARRLAAGRALGYGPGAVWLWVIVPELWPLIRLPVLVVLVYSLSTVDMALILGPSNPPVLSVLVMRAFLAPEAGALLAGSAGALLQAAVVGLSLGAFWAMERALTRLWLWRLRQGHRGRGAEGLVKATRALALGLGALGLFALAALVVWSFAWRWPWPAPLPQGWSLAAWRGAGTGLAGALGNTLLLATASTALALLLAIGWLEGEDRGGLRRARWAEALIYLPLLIPQIAFLYGLSVVFLRLGLGIGPGAVIWAHALFVFPYVMIALSDPWRALDPRLTQAAAALGAGPWRRLVAVKLPILAGPILTAAAVGLAVSVAQYLPTLFIGAGRMATLTTEAVTLATASDRRVTAAYASLQALVPMLGYGLALAAPVLMRRRFRNLEGTR